MHVYTYVCTYAIIITIDTPYSEVKLCSVVCTDRKYMQYTALIQTAIRQGIRSNVHTFIHSLCPYTV